MAIHVLQTVDELWYEERYDYPLVMTNIAMEKHHFQWKNPLYLVISHSNVNLPEGIPQYGPEIQNESK